MSKYLKLFLGIGLVLAGLVAITKVSVAQIIIPSTESHSYSFVVKEDGSANVWLRIDELKTKISGGTYSLKLPKGTMNGVKAWYRENGGGCIYPMEARDGTPAIEKGVSYDEMYPCKEEINEWKDLKVEQNENKFSVVIPKLKSVNNQSEITLSLGISFKMANITTKKWWGREIKVETGKSENLILYEQVSMDAPNGVYLRDKQTGPANWGEMMGSKTVVSQAASGLDSQQFSPAMFDMVGGGQIMKDKSNIQPGENFSFVLMSATSMWKLYVKEIGIILFGALVLILVTALLLRLTIGRKPLGWYMGVMFLIIILVGIIIWMTVMYKSIFYDYPMPLTDYNEGAEIPVKGNFLTP